MSTRLRFAEIDAVALLERPEHRRLLAHFRPERLPRSAIYSANGGDHEFMVVKSGRLRVFVSSGRREFTLGFLDRGASFFTGFRGTVAAVEDSEVLLARATDFFPDLWQFPELTHRFEVNLVGLFNCAVDMIEALAFQDVRARLASFILSAANEHGVAAREGVLVTFGVATEEIGRVIGTSRQTASTILNEFARQGIVRRVTPRTLCVRQLEELRAAAG